MSEQDPREAHRLALEKVWSWLDGARAAALLRAAERAGVLAAAARGATAAELATGPRGEALLEALVAYGVLEPDGPRLRLAPDFAVLAHPAAPLRLGDLLEREAVVDEQLAALPERPPPVGPSGVRALALGSGLDPTRPAAPAVAAGMGRALPEWHAAFEAGARHLELGCGAAWALLALMQVYPRVRAVGIELDPSTAEEARRRAEALGLSERVAFRAGDAAALEEVEAYDTCQWSQQFFPTASRAGALAAARRALRPGGLLLAPRFAEPAAELASRRSGPGRVAAANRALFAGWDVPVQDLAALSAELEAAGFEVLRAVDAPAGPVAWGAGQVMARRR